jgi:hypothetical protein
MSASYFPLRLVSLIALLALLSPAQAQIDGGFLAGAARIDITPQHPVRMSGYASRKELSTAPQAADLVIRESIRLLHAL